MWKHLLKRNVEALALTVPLAAISAVTHGYGPAPLLGGVLIVHAVWSLAVVLAFAARKLGSGGTTGKP